MNTKDGKSLVAITGFGLVTSLGIGVETNWQALLEGKSGIKTISRFDPAGLKTTIAATTDFEEVKGVNNIQSERVYNLANLVIHEAMDMGQLATTQLNRYQLFCALPSLEPDWKHVFAFQAALRRKAQNSSYKTIEEQRSQLQTFLPNLYQDCFPGHLMFRLNTQFNLGGKPLLINTACSSGATAIKLAVLAIRRGDIDGALVVAAESSVSHENIARFSRLDALSKANEEPSKASRPFDIHRDGFVMGEGAAAMLLERVNKSDSRQQRRVRGFVLGVGSATDNYHRTRSNPNASEIVRCMDNALKDANLAITDIDSINAHGTSTPENDRTEALGINLLLGDKTKKIKVTSNKSMIGHTTCAAGLIEGVISLLTIQAQKVPPTINCDQPEPEINFDIVAHQCQPCRIKTVLSNSFAFGGQNESLIFAVEPQP